MSVMFKKTWMAIVVLVTLISNAQACLVKDPSGILNVRNAPDGLVTGTLKNGTLVVIEERRGDWVRDRSPPCGFGTRN